MLCRDIKELHRQAAQDLRVDEETKAEMEQLLSELQQLLVGVSIMQDLTMRAKDSLVSFGERLSTRLFAAFLRKEVSPPGPLLFLHQQPLQYGSRWSFFTLVSSNILTWICMFWMWQPPLLQAYLTVGHCFLL